MCARRDKYSNRIKSICLVACHDKSAFFARARICFCVCSGFFSQFKNHFSFLSMKPIKPEQIQNKIKSNRTKNNGRRSNRERDISSNLMNFADGCCVVAPLHILTMCDFNFIGFLFLLSQQQHHRLAVIVIRFSLSSRLVTLLLLCVCSLSVEPGINLRVIPHLDCK